MKDPTVGFISLGCPKALVDSERILTTLRTDGYQVVANYDSADLVVVNTCGFIDAAVEELNSTIQPIAQKMYEASAAEQQQPPHAEPASNDADEVIDADFEVKE